MNGLNYTLIDPEGHEHPFGLVMSGGICETMRSILRHGLIRDRARIWPVSFTLVAG